MDAFDRGDPDSSQATQMIQDLLEHEPSPSKSGSVHHFKATNQSLQSNETSNSPHSIPQYHFHGLASTQTQSQHYADEEEPAEGSQKENIGSTKAGKESPPVQPIPSSSLNVIAKPDTAAPSTDKATTKRATNVTFQSPRPKGATGSNTTKVATRQSPYKSTPSRYKQPPRPPPRASSQDSFADPIDQEALLLATAEQFALPLSELTKESPQQNPDTSSGTSGSDSMYLRTSVPTYPRRTSPPKGRVLVEATPSQSTQSQSQSQPHSQETDDQPQNQQGLDPPSDDEDSGRLNEIFNNSHNPPAASLGNASPVHIHPDLIPTQSSEDDQRPPEPSNFIAETQPSTQVDDSHIDATPFSMIESVLRTTSAPSGGGRSLLSMVHPEAQERYRTRGYAQNSVQVTYSNIRTTSSNFPGPSVVQSDLEEKQPSFPEAPPPPRRGFPTRSLASSSVVPSAPPSAVSKDAMDVVPDSEPARMPAPPTPKKVAAVDRNVRVGGSAAKGKAVARNEDVEMRPPDRERFPVAEEEEEEEDIPLAKAAAATAVPKKRGRPPGKKTAVTNAKGKQVANTPAPPEPIAPTTQTKTRATAAAAKPMPKPTLMPAARSWETGVVPSSVPEQDNKTQTRNMRNRPAIIAEPKKKAPPKAPRSTRSASNVPTPAAYAKYEHEDKVHTGDDEEDDEGSTEPDDYQDADFGTARKRKRGSLDRQAGSSKGTRSVQKRNKRNDGTPGVRGSAKPSASLAPREQGSRVFALWTADGHYYPGIVHSVDNASRYNIKFDDGTDAWLSIEFMRACELRVGDEVLHGTRNRPSSVVNVDRLKEGIVDVCVDDQVESKLVSELRIAHKAITHNWQDRRVAPHNITTTVRPVKKQVSPSPSKMSIASLPPLRGSRKKVLSKTGFIVTLAAGKQDWEREKDTLMTAVKSSGGVVIDDLNTVIRMDGKHAAGNNRWTIKREDVAWIGGNEIERLFLLADDPNQKPKFLIALALGIPCLSTAWLEESVKNGVESDWAGFLLPQGFSAHLDARASQQVDVDWGNSQDHVRYIMDNRVPSKLFAGKTILCIGQDMVCQPKTKRRLNNDDKAVEASNSVPRIILAMGADVVEAVTEARHAASPLNAYDYVVIREPSQYCSAYAEANVVHWAWVKDCLIASRYLPLPTWTYEEDSQPL